MKPINDRDAFGREVLAFYEGDTEACEIIERDDGYIDASPRVGFYFAPFAEWPAPEQQAIGEICRGQQGGRALDLGSGAGRVELYLEEQGVAVVGIDNSPLAVEVCRRRGARDVRLCPVTRIGPHLGMFDNILMFGNNWGLMGSFRRARWLLNRFQRITTPEARIIAISRDVRETDTPAHLAYHDWNRARGRRIGQLRLRVRQGLACTRWFDYLMSAPEEMQEILEGTGWKAVKFIPGEAGMYAAVIEKSVFL